MMIRLLFLISMAICNLSLYGQTSVYGHVKDKNKSPLQGCTVYLVQADTIVGGSITDSKGNFSIKGLHPGDYVCHISMIGFKKIEHPFSLKNHVRLPQFMLEESATQLEEVAIIGDKRNIVKSGAGTTTFFISEHAQKTSTAYEALAEIPLLTINPVERTIKLTTGESPLILINGIKHPDYIEVLNPELIESVEVIETPSARHIGEENTTCILNIHLKRTTTPTYFNGNVFTQHAVTSRHGVTGSGIESGNTNSSLYLNLQHFYFSNDQSNQYEESLSGSIRRNFQKEQLYSSNSYYVTLGGDRIFSEKSYAAFALKYIGNPTDTENYGQGKVGYANGQQLTDATNYRQSTDKYHLSTIYLHYKHSFSKQQSLETTGNYAYSSSKSIGEQKEQNNLYQYHSLIDFSNHRHYGKLDLDYTQLIQNKYTLTSGFNISYSNTNIDDKKDLFPVYNYRKWQKYLYAGFDNSRSRVRFNYTLSIGIDMLFTKTDGVKKHYIDLLPVMALAYKFNQTHTLNLSYQRSRHSPSLDLLNPRNRSIDSLYIIQGNPYLKPSVQDQVRLSYKFSYQKLYLEPYLTYAYSSKLINAIGTVKNNIYIQSYQNFLCANFLTAGTSASYNLPYGQISISTYYQKRYQRGMSFGNAETWNFNLNSYLYYKQASLSLNISYTTNSYGYTTKTAGTPWSNATLSYNLPQNWRVYLIGQTFLGTGMRTKSWVKDKNHTTYHTNRMTDRSPMLLIGASYTFKNKVANKWRNKKQFYNDDYELQSIGIK